MDSSILVESFLDFSKSKNIDKTTMVKVLEEIFRTMIRKKYDSDENFDVIINSENGDLEIWRKREIVDDNSEDIWDYDKISLSEARKIEADFEIGEEVVEPITIDFGRRLIQTARQALVQKIKELEKDTIYQKYKDAEGDLINVEVYQVLSREMILVDSGGNELIMPRSEQIPKDRFKKGDHIRAVIQRVDIHNGSPKIILSRSSPLFLERLFEAEIPEVEEGLIAVRKVVREPGERAKVAVESFDDRIDPVGTCVGMKGTRIHSIIRELHNENIDVINHTDNLELLIARSLSPAKITSIQINKERKRATLSLKPDQISMAIGKGGQNIKLAGRLVGLELDVFRDVPSEGEEEDVSLLEFGDEIEDWVIDELHRIGLDTAKQVLKLNKEELVRRTELEEETIDDILRILREEFED